LAFSDASGVDADGLPPAELTALERANWEATVRDDKEFFRGSMAPEFKGFFADGTVAQHHTSTKERL
jgi:hypothetical protein